MAGALAAYPMAMGALGGHLVTSKAAAKLGVSVEAQRARAGWGGIRLYGVVIGRDKGPIMTVDRLEIPYSALWGRGVVMVDGPAANLVRGGAGDNVSTLLARLRGASPAATAAVTGKASAPSLPSLTVRGGSLHLTDNLKGLALTVGVMDANWETGRRYQVDARQISGRFGTHSAESDPMFGADSLTLEGTLSGMRPSGWPEASVREGFVRPLATLPLTGISGVVRPLAPGKGPAGALDLFFSGSYGGAKRSLWTATGQVRPSRDLHAVEGTLAVRAERFSLDKIAEILPSYVLEPEDTEIDASIELNLQGRLISFAGKLDVTGLNLLHEKLASERVNDLAFGVEVDGSVDLDKRRLVLTQAEGRLGSLVARGSGSVELAPGSFHFKNGRELHNLPKIEVQFRVPRIACAKLLASIPGPIVPHLQGFVLQGNFEADIHTKIDFSNLDTLDLGGKVGINGCQVVKAPPEVKALAGGESLVQTVEVPPEPTGVANTGNTMAFIVGADSPDFVPFSGLSPHLINAIMTTEDSGFFKHRGWVTPVFKTALRRNLENGGFRLGASSITMQMVKNLLLSQEKTLSRKLQELFLVWYLEQILPKERILELYFNAIEFGPRLYGIGPATRHYFGKEASDITPQEAAFFASILPSPKRRYIHYCHGSLTPAWEKYLRRILTRMHERDRLTDEEYAMATASTLTFDRAEMTMTERQCLDWVRRITAKPEVEVEGDADAQ